MSTRCVIVDDDTDFQRSARRLLERQGVKVVGMASGRDEASMHIAQHSPDVVLLDVVIAGQAGFDISWTRPGPQTTPPPVIMTCSNAESDYYHLVEGSSAIGIITKESLSAARIHALL